MNSDDGRFFPVDPQHRVSAPEFGQAANDILDVRTFDLSTARDKVRFPIPAATFAWVLNSTDADAVLDVRPNADFAAIIPFRRGMVVRGIEFKELYLSNASQAGKSITILFTRANNIQIENPETASLETRLAVPDSATAYVERLTSTVVEFVTAISANPNRKLLRFKNEEASTQEIYFDDIISIGTAPGGRDEPATAGISLAAGETIELEYTGAIYWFNGNALGDEFQFSAHELAYSS